MKKYRVVFSFIGDFDGQRIAARAPCDLRTYNTAREAAATIPAEIMADLHAKNKSKRHYGIELIDDKESMLSEDDKKRLLMLQWKRIHTSNRCNGCSFYFYELRDKTIEDKTIKLVAEHEFLGELEETAETYESLDAAKEAIEDFWTKYEQMTEEHFPANYNEGNAETWYWN